MALVIEDGTIIAGANSYATLAQIQAYNVQRGVTLPDDDDEVMTLAMVAMDYLEAYEPRWKGDRASPLLQELSWPRANVYLYSTMFLSNAIPSKLVSAQCYLVGVASTVDLYAVQDSRAITKEVIGPLETDYDTKTGATLGPIIPQLDALLAQLINTSMSGLRSVRL